jgi:hypothetical protein
MEDIVRVLMAALGLYGLVGVLLLVPFHRFAVPVIDQSASGASWGFKVVVSPGLVALWPVILWKWNTARRGGHAHGRPDAPVSSLRIRQSQSLLLKLIAIAIPLLAAGALLGW